MNGNVNISLERYHELLESERKYKQSYIEFVINRNELNKEKYEFKIGSEIKSKVIINKILRPIIRSLKNNDNFNSNIAYTRLDLVKKIIQERKTAVLMLCKVYEKVALAIIAKSLEYKHYQLKGVDDVIKSDNNIKSIVYTHCNNVLDGHSDEAYTGINNLENELEYADSKSTLKIKKESKWKKIFNNWCKL